MLSAGTTLLYLVKYCLSRSLMLYYSDIAFLMQPICLPLCVSSVFHFTPLTPLTNSSTELEHSSPHTSTPGELSVLPTFLLSWSLTLLSDLEGLLSWTSHRWYLGVTWYVSSHSTVGIPSLSPDSRMSGLLSHIMAEHFFSSYWKKSWGARFGGPFLVCLKIDLFYSCIWLTIQPGTGLRLEAIFPQILG